MSSSLSQAAFLHFTDKATTISEIQQAHAQMLKLGLLPHHSFAASRLITSAAATSPSYAHSILSQTQNPNSYTYNTVIRAFADSPNPQHSLSLFIEMLSDENELPHPDKYTFTFVLKACANLTAAKEGKQIHGHVIKNGIATDEFISNTLIHMYARSGDYAISHDMLDKMPDRSVISWNALLSVYTDRGLMELAGQLFDGMPERNIESFNFMVSGNVGAGLIQEARKIFDDMALRNTVSYNAMITGYVSSNCYEEALDLFKRMQSADVEPNDCTLVNILSACAHIGALSQGKWIHAYIEKNQINLSGFLATALVDMYSKCGCIEKSLDVFHSTSNKDISTWNSMISGLGNHGFGTQALDIFTKMVTNGLQPNEVTFVGVLSACSRAGLLKEGRENFEKMFSLYKIEPKIQHYSCMVDLFGRFGLVQEAKELVERLSMEEAPAVWESLLGACRNYGNVEMVEQISKKLLETNPRETSGYVQLSNVHASMARWNEAAGVRRKMRAEGVRKVPGCSMIEVNGVIHEFLAGEGMLDEIHSL